MSPGRETYDGTITGRNTGLAKRRNSISNKGQVVKPASAKRTSANSIFLESEDSNIEEAQQDRYLITYADLITLLLGLFIILYAISNIDSQKYQKVLQAFGNTFGSEKEILNIESKLSNSDAAPATQLKDKLSNIIKDHGYEDFVKMEETERGIVIHIMDQILFNSGSARLESKSYKVLNKLASVLKELPNDIRIEGHTDDVPINSSEYQSNWHLSVARALNTAYYLIHEEKLPQEKLSIIGNSEFKPIASNDETGRAKNRRVDIVIIRE